VSGAGGRRNGTWHDPLGGDVDLLADEYSTARDDRKRREKKLRSKARFRDRFTSSESETLTTGIRRSRKVAVEVDVSITVIVDAIVAFRVFAGREREVGVAVFLRDGSTADADTLRKHCGAKIAAHKIPRYVWLVNEQLPRNASGKFLKRQLRDTLSTEDAG